jgi:hypothetical protein
MKKITAIILALVMLFSVAQAALAWNMPMDAPPVIEDKAYQFTSIRNGEVLLNKPTGRLPAMGWNSWHAFASNINPT